ncbi:hypothetical protein BGW39_008056 [Mortierella sp. 14UC]|nr:hypothetical protein BGW39_008056 [Mortierella sp. 14UC]
MLRKSASLEACQLKLALEAVSLSTEPDPQANNNTASPQDLDSDQEDAVATKPQKRKRQAKKQQTHPDNQSSAIKGNNAPGGSTVKKERYPKKKIKQETPPPSSVTSSPRPEPALLVVVPISKSDPCAVLPTEPWHRILSFLPLAKAAQTSIVSKIWLYGARSSPIWKTPASGSNFASAAKVEASNDGIGHHGGGSGGSGDGHGGQSEQHRQLHDGDVSVKQQGGDEAAQEGGKTTAQEGQAIDSNVCMLCFTCRRSHFDDHPEALRPGAFGNDQVFQEQTKKVTRSGTCDTYGLNADDIHGLNYEPRRNPYRRNGWPMRLYDRDEIQDIALETHAGWVGVDAVRDGVLRARRERFNQRIKWGGYVTLPWKSRK